MAKIAPILLLIALGLLIIYGLDTMVASQSMKIDETQPVDPEFSSIGFLPMNEAVRGGIFGGGAMILSLLGFVIGRNDPSKSISILLFINGGLIILGMIMVMALNVLESGEDVMKTVGSTMLFGGILIALGIIKIVVFDKRRKKN